MKNNTIAKEPIRAYKVTDSMLQCRGFQYEIGKEYKIDGTISLCNHGFHFCLIANHCFNYYDFLPSNRLFEIEVYGEVIHGDDKSVTNHFKIVREIPWADILNVVNTGSNNTGRGNTGDWNTGNRNTGNSNTGNRNTGNRNTGNRNTGDSNTGNRNTGNRNTGNWNTGNWNTGNWNTGDSNTGNRNTGNRNTGNRNTGNWNTGDSNTGNWNTGNRNTGNRNTGNWNTGDSNTGDSNTGDRNTGAFCTGEKYMRLFNKESNWTEQEWLNSKAYSLMCDSVDAKMWVLPSQMTDEEKKAHPSYETVGGYLKDIPFKEAFTNAWHNWNPTNRRAFTTLPNFDADIFFEITGVKI